MILAFSQSMIAFAYSLRITILYGLKHNEKVCRILNKDAFFIEYFFA
jgi:hypothetical protein